MTDERQSSADAAAREALAVVGQELRELVDRIPASAKSNRRLADVMPQSEAVEAILDAEPNVFDQVTLVYAIADHNRFAARSEAGKASGEARRIRPDWRALLNDEDRKAVCDQIQRAYTAQDKQLGKEYAQLLARTPFDEQPKLRPRRPNPRPIAARLLNQYLAKRVPDPKRRKVGRDAAYDFVVKECGLKLVKRKLQD